MKPTRIKSIFALPVVCLATAGGFYALSSARRDAQAAKARIQLTQLSKAIELFKQTHGDRPRSDAFDNTEIAVLYDTETSAPLRMKEANGGATISGPDDMDYEKGVRVGAPLSSAGKGEGDTTVISSWK